MPSVPAPADPGRHEDPAWPDRLCAQDDDPSDAPEEYWDPELCAPPPGQDELTADELAGIAAAACYEMLALDAASTGPRGRGRPPETWDGPAFPSPPPGRTARREGTADGGLASPVAGPAWQSDLIR